MSAKIAYEQGADGLARTLRDSARNLLEALDKDPDRLRVALVDMRMSLMVADDLLEEGEPQ